VFAPAIERRAASIVLAHNHPSGDPEPSDDDLALTRRLVQAGILLGIEVLDHLVIGHGGYVSLKSRGLM
jgi:DNA repair protein RadC